MTPSIPDSQLEKFIRNTGWNPDQKGIERVFDEESLKDENVLIFAKGKGIHVLDRDERIHKITERRSQVETLCSHKGILYDGGKYNGLYQTITNEVIASRQICVSHITSHLDKLYFATGNQVIEALTCNVKQIRVGEIQGLCSHKGRLLDYSNNTIIYTLAEKPFSGEDERIMGKPALGPLKSSDLCSHKDRLYICHNNIIYDLGSRTCIDQGWYCINALCSHEGSLYFAGDDKGIHDITNGKPYAMDWQYIRALCSHPRKDLVEEGILPP